MRQESTNHQPSRSNFRLCLDEKLLELKSNAQKANHQQQQAEGQRIDSFIQRNHSFNNQLGGHPSDSVSDRSLDEHAHVKLPNIIHNDIPQQHYQQQQHRTTPNHSPDTQSRSSWQTLASEAGVRGLSGNTPAETATSFNSPDQYMAMGIQEQSAQMASTPVSAQRNKQERVESKHGSPLQEKPHDQDLGIASNIEGLLAEGKAAAIQKGSNDISKEYSLKTSFMLERLKKQDDTIAAPLEVQNNEEWTRDKSFSENHNAIRHPVKNENQHPPEKRDRRQSSMQYNERLLYEPSRRVSAIQDNNPSPAVDNPTPSNRKDQVEHEFLHLAADEVEELRIWLVSTGYHDVEYRRKVINRHKRLAALEKERLDLMREEKLDREAWASRSDVGATHSFTPVLNVDSNMLSLSTALSSSPSLNASVAHGGTSELRGLGLGAVNESQVGGVTSRHAASDGPQAPLGPSGLKRDYSAINEGQNDTWKPARLSRTSTSTSNRETRNTHEEATGSWKSQRGLRQDHDSPLPEKKDYQMSRNYNTSPSHRGESVFYGGNHIRGRGGYFSASRGGRRGGIHSPQRPSTARKGRLKLDAEGSSFFLIKCIDYEFVDECQKNGIWITQNKNLEKLTKAYETRRNVILFFSVNESKAFQGYARMECAPGEGDISTPPWAFKLGFNNNPPFRVKWINTSEILFRDTGHLKNAYNEGAPVLFGRDGQEVDPQCGMDLCALIDDMSNYH